MIAALASLALFATLVGVALFFAWTDTSGWGDR